MKTTSGELLTRQTKKHGKVYVLRYQHNGTRRKVTLKDEDGHPITSKRKAEEAAARFLSPVQQKTEVDRRKAVAASYEDAAQTAQRMEEDQRPRLSIGDAWEAFSISTERPQCSAVMLADYRRRWFQFADWMNSNHPDSPNMEDTTRQHANAFVQELDADTISANRRNKIVQGCRLVFRVLADDCAGMLNPFRNIRNRTLTTHGHRELSEGELMKVCQSAEGELRTLLAVGMYTALRLGDACLLRWDEVALHTNRIAVVPRKTKRTGKTVVIPLHPVLRTILEETPSSKRAGYVMPGLADGYGRDTATVCKMLRLHFESNDIETQERHPDQKQATCIVGFHSLRHSFVSMCAERGVPLAVVQELCGHGSPAIQKHYIHLGADATNAAINCLPAFDGNPPEIDEKTELLALIDGMEKTQVSKALALMKKML